MYKLLSDNKKKLITREKLITRDYQQNGDGTRRRPGRRGSPGVRYARKLYTVRTSDDWGRINACK